MGLFRRKDPICGYFKKLMIPILIGIVAAIAIFFFFGIPTDVIENQKYIRMVPATFLDMLTLVITSLLFGTYIGLTMYIWFEKKGNPFSSSAAGGTVGSFVAISCPTCIHILVSIFGAAFLLKYLDPLRPFIGFLSLGLISFGIYKNIQLLRCNSCIAGT